jgi:hypothetical protein
MRRTKLKLDAESLQVTSFDAASTHKDVRGTVKGHNPVIDKTAWGGTCSGCSWWGLECCTDPYCSEVNC